MVEHFPLMVPGAEVSGEKLEVKAPFDGSLIATVDQAGEEAVEQALQTAFDLFKNRDGWIKASERIDILLAAGEIMKQRREQLAVEAAREGGKPLMDSLVEVDRAIDGVNVCIETLRTQSGTEIPMNLNAASANRIAFTHHEPIGVALAFSAFNHPLNLILHQIGPAVAAGCPSIVKPAGATPLSCLRFVQILHEAGLPPQWCQALVPTSRDLNNKLVSDKRVGFFTFIGSGPVGWMLRSKLAPGTRCALEHGGAAPVIVAADADLDDAVPLLAKGAFYHAGQVCVSVQRIFADRAIARDLANRIAEKAKASKVGDPTAADTEIGPLIRHAEVTRVDEWVKEAAAGGAEIVCGGDVLSDSCYAPTVLFDPPEDVRVSTTEIFGPVVCIYPFDDLNEAIRRANDVPYAFQSSVFTTNLHTALRASKRLDAAAVMVNDHTAFRVDWMPFAGLRESGLGVGGIPYTMHDMQIEKLIVIRSKEV